MGRDGAVDQPRRPRTRGSNSRLESAHRPIAVLATGRLWLAATLALLGFTALHVPVWGWGFAVGGLVSGAAAMAFFAWQRDLLAMMVFHTAADATGLILAPMFSDWWKTPAHF